MSDTSSRTGVVDPKIQSTTPLEGVHPLADLIVFSDTFEFKESYIENGSEFRIHYFGRNIDNPIGRIGGVKLDLLASGEAIPDFSSFVSPVADPKPVEAYPNDQRARPYTKILCLLVDGNPMAWKLGNILWSFQNL